jgi:hypothetical protein
LSKRSSPAFEAWSSAIQRKDVLAESPSSCDQADEVPDVEAPVVEAAASSGFVVIRRNHNSKPSVLAAKRA